MGLYNSALYSFQSSGYITCKFDELLLIKERRPFPSVAVGHSSYLLAASRQLSTSLTLLKSYTQALIA